MAPSRLPPRSRPTRSRQTRERGSWTAVRELLAEGTFHESTVEEVADRAGVSRATLYQHFGSRLELVDAICDTFAANPALARAARRSSSSPDADAALAETIANSIRFWSSEDAVLRELYGVAAIDPARAGARRPPARRPARRARAAGPPPRTDAATSGTSTNERRAVTLLLVLHELRKAFRDSARHPLSGTANRLDPPNRPPEPSLPRRRESSFISVEPAV